jgi:hypothetical protein
MYMSGISSIYGDSAGLSLVDFLNESENDGSSLTDSSSVLSYANGMLASLRNKNAQNAYGGSGATTLGQEAVSRALKEMGADGTQMITFADIAAYRVQLENEFTLRVRVDLASQGVSPDTEFTLTMSPNGKIQVECADIMTKTKIEQYLVEHLDICDQFGYIQALSNLERARQSPAGSQAAWREVRSAKKAYQAQAVEAFFGEALNSGMNYSSLMASFADSASSEPSAAFYAGLDFTV